MARKPMSAAHRAAISAGMKRYWATRNAKKSQETIQTDKGNQITKAEAALIMFGPTGRPAKRKKRKR